MRRAAAETHGPEQAVATAETARLSFSSLVLLLWPLVMSLLGAYKKKSSYDGYECLQLVDSGRDNYSIGKGSSSGTLGGSIAATLGPKAAPLRGEDCSTMDSSGKMPRPHTAVSIWQAKKIINHQ